MIRRSRIENLIKRSGIIESDKEKWNGKADISNERETDIRNVRYTISGRAEKPGNSFERIYEVVRQIPRGKVASYGQIAALAGNRRWSRVVGYALHANPDENGIPCYRVVTKEGRVSEAFAFGGGNRQVELLKADGVGFVDGHVDMERFQWETPWIE